MLKVKKNVDLKRLSIFGFEYNEKTNSYIMFFGTKKKEYLKIDENRVLTKENIKSFEYAMDNFINVLIDKNIVYYKKG